jgi:hypothetical protein
VVTEGSVGTGDIGDPEVHVGCEPTVELDLSVADRLTVGAAAEVEEAEIHRLLHLVRAVAQEEHDCRVRLGHRRAVIHVSSVRSSGG